MNMGYIAGFDYGLKNIGVSIGQKVTGTATEHPPFKAKEGVPNWQQLETLLKEWQIKEAVVGLPLNMDDSENDMCIRARKFANRLHGRFGITVHLVDERLSTREAKSEANEAGHRGNYRQNPIDSIAARLILESFLNSGS